MGGLRFFFLVIFLCCSLSPSRSWIPIAGSSTLPDTRECCLSRLGTYSQHSSSPTPQPQSSPSTSLSSQFSLTPSPRSSHMISRSAFGFPFLTCSWTCYSALAFPGLQYDYSIFLPTQCPSPLSRSPVILLSRNTLYHPWTSPFLLHLENPPISDHMLLPSVSSHSYRWRASLIFQLALSRVHLYLLCTCIFSSPSPPPPPSFLSSFGPCFPFPLSASHPLSPPPPSHRLITLVHDADMHASFPLRILSQHILSLYYSSTRIYLFSLGYASINALFAAFFPLPPSFSLLSHLCAD